MSSKDFGNLKTNKVLCLVKSVCNQLPTPTVHRSLVTSLRTPIQLKLLQ